MATADCTAEAVPLTLSAPKRISILGSTGSIGCNTIDLIERNAGAFQVEALTAYRSVDKLARQARALGAKLAVVGDPDSYGALKSALAGSGVEAAAGPAAIDEAAGRPADFVMAAIVGSAGLSPTLAAINRGAVVGLANKEALVCGGALMTAAVARNGARLLPVDSEHNAIFQVLESDRLERVERIILTASGGPFRQWDPADMARATPDQAVAHPNWDMGAKISVDSATMMNKGLEVIEARHLFGLPQERIDVVVHPQSVIHSMVAYVDGSVLAQLGQPDMRTPIAYSLAWPDRMSAPVEKLDFANLSNLTFEAPDYERFPALRLAQEALGAGGSAPIALNAANEVAVERFLGGRIGFMEIAGLVAETLAAFPAAEPGSLDEIYAFDQEARRLAGDLSGKFEGKR